MVNREAAIFNVLRRVSQSPIGDTVLDRTLAPFNPFSSSRYRDPYALYDSVRDRGRLYWHRRVQMWIVTGYDEVIEILRGPVSVDRSDMATGISSYRGMDPRYSSLLLANMLMQDPPNHTRLRRLVNRGFTPRAVRRLEQRVEQSTAAMIESLRSEAGAGPVELTAHIRPLPIRMICDLLGVPEELRAEMVAIADVISQFADPVTGFEPAEMDQAVEALSVIVTGLAAERRSNPTDDLISAIAGRDADGEPLTLDEIISMVALLIIAGQETTSGLIGNSIVALSRFPDQRATLANRENLDDAIDEFLRFDTPIQATDRTVVEDFAVADGRVLRQGQIAMLLLGAANRDPRRYPNPTALKLNRQDTRPLSFGHGAHHCLGAALAKIQARAVIGQFVNAFPDYELDQSQVGWKRSTTLRGPSRLMVSLKG